MSSAIIRSEDEKRIVRAEMRKKRLAVAPEVRARVSHTLSQMLLLRALAEPIAVYLASPDEIDLTEFIQAKLAVGVRLLAPRWTGSDYCLAPLTGFNAASLRIGPHGIAEPNCEPTGESALTWLVPGLAFTRGGDRLGYGGGWYDRLLSSAPPMAQTIGISYAFQIVPALPREPHDCLLKEVVFA